MKAFYSQADTRPGVVALQVTPTHFPCVLPFLVAQEANDTHLCLLKCRESH